MPKNSNPQDRTGHEIKPLNSSVVIHVKKKIKGAEVYLLEDYIDSDPDTRTGAYFVTAEQLENMITAYETGEWGYEL